MWGNGVGEREVDEMLGMKRKKKKREEAFPSSLRWDYLMRSFPRMLKAQSVLGLDLKKSAVDSHCLSGAALPLEGGLPVISAVM